MKKQLIPTLAMIGFVGLVACQRNGQNTNSSVEAASSNAPLISSSMTVSVVTHEVKDFNLANGITYTGTLDETNRPEGEGTLSYANGDTLLATFKEGVATSGSVTFADRRVFKGTISLNTVYVFSLVKGKLTYPDARYYQGSFKDNLFEDSEGKFSYHTIDSEGNISYSFVYTGGWVAGSCAGQKGNLEFPAEFKGENGLWELFDIQMEGEKKPVSNVPVIYKEFERDHYFKGEGYWDGLNASYVKDTTYQGMSDFGNGCTYTGEYKNGVYEGQGEFVWDFSDGYSKIVGTFVNGTPVGQICTKYFPCNYTKTIGCWSFKGLMGSFESPAGNQQGEGEICFEDGSLYTGGIYFNGDFAAGFLRNGIGTMDGSGATLQASWLEGIGSTLSNLLGSYLIEYFDGAFDKGTAFIKGDGIMYISAADHTPYGYITGNWEGWNRLGDYSGASFTPREGFTHNLASYI